jgi:sugar lactone lactonase YvrE
MPLAFSRQPIDTPYLFMGEEDIHRMVIAKVIDGVPQTFAYFGEFGSGEGQFKGPEGVFPGPNGNLYVSDTGNNRVQVFDLTGKFKFQFGNAGAGPGEFNEPGQGGADLDGNVYISDSGNKRIQVFDENGKFLYQWGSAGTGPGQFTRPIDAFVDTKNKRVLVCDLYNAKISVFDLAGNFLFEFGGQGTDIGQFQSPHSVIYDETTDSIFVSDMVANNIQKFDSQGKFVGRYGRYGTALGEFKTPSGIAAIDDKLFVMDHTNHRGQIINPQTGVFLLAFGENIIGIPNDVLIARQRMEEIEQNLRTLSSQPGAVSKETLTDLTNQLESAKKAMSVPSVLKLDHH